MGGLDCEPDYRKIPSERSFVMPTRSEHVECEEEVVRQSLSRARMTEGCSDVDACQGERVIGLAELDISKPQGTRAVVWAPAC